MRSTIRYSPTTYTTPPRPPRLSRQAHSYHTEVSPTTTQSPYKDDPPEAPIYAAGSLGRATKISHHLFPLISKFEALDALSYEMKIPSLRPTPLQVTKNSSPRRGGVDDLVSIKLEAIFSPRRRNRGRYGDTLLENIVASSPEDVFTSGTAKRSGSGRLKQTELSSKVNNIRLREQNSLATIKEREFWSKEQRIEDTEDVVRERENSIVRARIRFFDGCMDKTSISAACLYLYDTNSAQGSPYSAPSAASTFKSTPSLRQSILLATPKYHKPTYFRPTITQLPSGPPTTRDSKAKTTSTNSGSPQRATKSDATSGSRIRPLFGPNVPNPFLQTPHTNPPTRRVSPKSSFKGQIPEKRSRIARPVYESSKVPDLVKKDASPKQKRALAPAQQPLAQRPKPAPQDRRRTSAKQEAFDRGKSLERTHDTKIGCRDPKDNDLKMLRERGVVAKSFALGPWSLSKATGTRIPRPKWRDFSNPAPSAPPSSSTIRHGTDGSKTNKRPSKAERPRIASLVGPPQVRPSTPTKATCGGIYDKIKRWESRAEIMDEWREEQHSCSPYQTMNNSFMRKSIFENPWNDEVGKELAKRGLDGHEVQAVVQEFQDIAEDSNKGEWKMVVAPRLGRAEFAPQNDGETEDGSGDMGMRIIVREAQCGLAEPKPLRLLEMKRMILLCRERVSVGCPNYMERDRGRAYPMKV